MLSSFQLETWLTVTNNQITFGWTVMDKSAQQNEDGSKMVSVHMSSPSKSHPKPQRDLTPACSFNINNSKGVFI